MNSYHEPSPSGGRSPARRSLRAALLVAWAAALAAPAHAEKVAQVSLLIGAAEVEIGRASCRERV